MEHSLLMGFLGGVMIGTAGAIYLLMNGRILGPTASFLGYFSAPEQRGEKMAFLLGLAGLPLALSLVVPLATHAGDNLVQLAIGGLLVGVGTSLANGCTSGHGVCGISRLSPRSIVATLAYIGAGMAVMAVLRHLWGLI